LVTEHRRRRICPVTTGGAKPYGGLAQGVATSAVGRSPSASPSGLSCEAAAVGLPLWGGFSGDTSELARSPRCHQNCAASAAGKRPDGRKASGGLEGGRKASRVATKAD